MKGRGRMRTKRVGIRQPTEGKLPSVRSQALPRLFSRTQPVRFALAVFLLACLVSLKSPAANAQGILTVTPGRSIATSAGTGTPGFSGDGGASTSAQLARPSGIAYDAAGDLFLADANNHVIREITPAGAITTVAGSGIAGFGGDGGPATSAFLDTPTAVAVDTSNRLYIADSHNHRIRVVAGGIITTLAGTGTPGYSGDGGPALAAQLALPTSLAVDASGNLYIADTNNHRIRKLTSGTLTTVAGNGEELFAGDGGPATAASLDQPTGIAVDVSGNLYIADKNNHRIRIVSTGGTISTLAGNGIGAFSGSFSGDGAAATAATLAKPVGVAVDSAGNIYIADTNNQRIRQISTSGTVATLAGTGDQGYAGDGGPASTAVLNSPRFVLADSTGLLDIADTANQRLRSSTPGQLTFASQLVGTTSAPQLLSLSNTGSAPLTIDSLTFSGPFTAAPGATCSALPVTLAPGASCSENISFQPAAAGPSSGALVIAGQGVASQTVLFAGTASAGTTTLLLTANKASALSGETVIFTATLSTASGPAAIATGSVAFYAGSQLLGSGTLTEGIASLSISSLPDGVQTITAVFSGNTSFGRATSIAFAENVVDVSLALNAAQTTTVEPGHSVAVPLILNASSTSGVTGNISFSTSTLPAGLSIAFSPTTVPLNSGQLPFTMTVTAPPAGSSIAAAALSLPGAAVLLGLLLFSVPRQRLRKVRPLTLLVFCCGGLLTLGTLTGCGTNTGFFGQQQQTYSITVTATATDTTGGTLTRNTVVSITVQ